MTLLNWEMAPDRVLIFSDTLSLTGDDHLPRSFMTKVHPVPHLNGVVTGTGIGAITMGFVRHVIEDMVTQSVAQLSTFAPDIIRGLWDDLAPEIPSGATATIYLFGLGPEGDFVGYAFRSTNDFVAEPLPYARAAKPPPADLSKVMAVETLEDWIQVAHVQQAEDRALPRAKRVGIGGDLWIYLLSRLDDGTLALGVQRACRLPHFDADLDLMLAQLPANVFDPHSQALLANALDDAGES